MSGAETFAAITGVYAIGSAVDVMLKANRFTNRGGLEEIKEPVTGVELYSAKQEFSPPIYINTGGRTGLSIPVGGSMDTEYVRAHSKFNTAEGSWTNYWAPDLQGRVRWINTVDQLSNVASQYKIDTGAFPVSLPIKLHEHKWDGPVWADRRSARIGPNKVAVARAAAFARRMPLSLTAGVAAVGTLGMIVIYKS